jgi:hypothetical protein
MLKASAATAGVSPNRKGADASDIPEHPVSSVMFVGRGLE